MKIRKYMSEMGKAFIKAHESIFLRDDDTFGTLDISNQKKFWKEVHHADIGGGPFENDCNFVVSPIYVDFESEADYVLFMLIWS